MKPIAMMGSVLAAGIAAAALALVWPQAKVQAQVAPPANLEGCSCAKPPVAGSGRDQISVYYCQCPGTVCVVTATTAGTNVPPNIVQSCR